MKLTRQLIILVLVMPRRFRKALMEFTGAKTYEECRGQIKLLSGRIDNIAKTFGIPEKSVVCFICNTHHTHGYVAKIRKWDGSYHIGFIANAKKNGCKTKHFEDHMGNGNRNAKHDHDDPLSKSKESIEEITCSMTKRYLAMNIIGLWWFKILLRRRSATKIQSVCRMFMKLKAYKRLRSIYRAKNCFAKIPVHNLGYWLKSWIKKWHIERENRSWDMIITNHEKRRDMTTTNLEKRRNEKKDMAYKLIRDLFNSFIQIKVRLDVACEQYLVKKQSEQKRQAFKMLCKPWREKKSIMSFSQNRIKKEVSRIFEALKYDVKQKKKSKAKEAKTARSQEERRNWERIEKIKSRQNASSASHLAS